MLEKPDLQDEKIGACLQEAYGLRADRVEFLPLGADLNTAVYRAAGEDGALFFVKLRRGDFDATAVALPKCLSDQGIPQIIPPLETQDGALWAELNDFKLILYPFVAGQDGYKVDLSDRQWIEFGAALKSIHMAALPPALDGRIPRETFSPRWREIVESFVARLDHEAYTDPVAVQLAEFLQAKRGEVLDLVGRAGRLAQVLQANPPDFVVCHSDLHAGNIHVDASGALYIVDWDNPILAPKERDLMYPGGGQFGNWRSPQEEEWLFYQGYGPAKVDPAALAYYRYERIVEDIAVYCEQLLLSDEGGEDREQALHYCLSNFWPGRTIDIAYRGDRT
jgi:spectinomycin phosphotransferase